MSGNEEVIVRLLSVELFDFKNVGYGKIEMPNSAKHYEFDGTAEILGIYGQNGSGKTAIIDAFELLHFLLQGKPLPINSVEYISSSEDYVSCLFKLYLETEKMKIEVFYHFKINRNCEICEEKLYYSNYTNGNKTIKNIIIDYNLDYTGMIIKPKRRFDEVITQNKENRVNLGVAKVIAKKEHKSFIFSEEGMSVFIDSFKNEPEALLILQTLPVYAKNKLFVIKNEHSGISGLHCALPFTIKCESIEGMPFNDLGLLLPAPIIIEENNYSKFSAIVNALNTVIKSIIPGMTVEIFEHGRQIMKDGTEGVKIEIMSKRDKSLIPLKYESQGIKKLLTILNVMIAMYNDTSVCMVIDELDAGVYEYLLGELLTIISESGKGQLLFTSHNLRPLEMINPDALFFTTTNANNRYIRLDNKKGRGTKNLRDIYLRAINLGGQEEQIYETTNAYEIGRAFRKAGRKEPSNNGKE